MAKIAGKTKARASKSAKGSRDILVVGTKMKEVVKGAGCMSSSDLVEAVSQKVHDMLAAAANRAKENNRATVRPYDL